eukprot:13589-Chlamydomonas_euryale.AAC.1
MGEGRGCSAGRGFKAKILTDPCIKMGQRASRSLNRSGQESNIISKATDAVPHHHVHMRATVRP